MSDRDQTACATWERRLVEALYPEDKSATEEARERAAWDFEVACRTYADVEGWDGVLRRVASAMGQRELPL